MAKNHKEKTDIRSKHLDHNSSIASGEILLPPTSEVRAQVSQHASWATYIKGVPGELRIKAMGHATAAGMKAVAKNPVILFNQTELQEITLDAIDEFLLEEYFKFELSVLEFTDLEELNVSDATDEDLVLTLANIEKATAIRHRLHKCKLTDRAIDALAEQGRSAAAHVIQEDELARGKRISLKAAIRRVDRAIAKVAIALDPDHGL